MKSEMFKKSENFQYRYIPILSISPAEMTALEELPGKDKDLILPIIPLKGWVGSHKLEKSVERIQKAIGKERYWVADVDPSFVAGKKQEDGKYPRDVFDEIEKLLSPENGYENWFKYLNTEQCSKAIPAIQFGDSICDLENLRKEIVNLSSLDRGLVVKFSFPKHAGSYTAVLQLLQELSLDNILVIFDYGQQDQRIIESSSVNSILLTLGEVQNILGSCLLSISCSSFPDTFAGYNNGANPIYERQLFNQLSKACKSKGISLVYSDRGSARADRIGGGGRTPPPRIDYPLAEEWRFVRRDFEDINSPGEGEKEELYTLVARTILQENYWNPSLRVWGTQVIELTSKGEMLGINSPMRSTAVRINIHMHQQLYYGLSEDEFLDTDEDWED